MAGFSKKYIIFFTLIKGTCFFCVVFLLAGIAAAHAICGKKRAKRLTERESAYIIGGKAMSGRVTARSVP